MTISASVSSHSGVEPGQLETPLGLTIKFSIVLEDIFSAIVRVSIFKSSALLMQAFIAIFKLSLSIEEEDSGSP